MYSLIDIENFLSKNTKLDKGYLDFPIPQELSASDAITAREQATLKSLQEGNLDRVASIQGLPSIEIFEGLLIELMNLNILPKLNGIGIELGAGLGIFSSLIIKHNKNVKGILSIEVCRPFAESGMGLTSDLILHENSNKVIPCHGTFDSIPISSGVVDFIIQIESLHHANTLDKPINESFRLLKPGGFFISIDRAWIDSIKDSTLNALLDHKYELKWLEHKGFDSNKIVTRRDNGEHEYRDREWQKAFLESGFKNLIYLPIHPKITNKFILKRLLTLLRINSLFGIKIPSRIGLFRGVISRAFHINPLKLKAQFISRHPRPLVISVWQK
jgi:SAM-dependent methyltransferase